MAVLLVGAAAPLGARPFIRGDVDGDGGINITDPIVILSWLYLGGSIECLDAADYDDNGFVEITDPIYSLKFQFLGGPDPHQPYPVAGKDPTTNDDLGCPPEEGVSPPAVTITSPRNLLVVGDPRLTVLGTISHPQIPLGDFTVKVNGELALLNVADGSFRAEVPLREGANQVTAVAQDAQGNAGSATVTVTLDTLAPTLVVENPPQKEPKEAGESDLVTDQDRVTLTGFLNDIGSSQAGGSAGGVTVRSLLDDGEVIFGERAADLKGKAFVLLDFPLRRGVNVIEAVGTDGVGNRSRVVRRQVTFQDLAGQRINRVSGDGQAGPIQAVLFDPLVVSLTDPDGRAVPSRAVKFEVIRNSALLSESIGAGNKVRELLVDTDVSGRAAAYLTLGDRVGAGYNRVRATAAGFQGEILFCASSTPKPPARILAAEGASQTGIPGQALTKALVALAVDEEGNPIPELPITFEVLEGGGGLSQGGTSGGGQGGSLQVMTNGEGLAAAVFHLGLEEGLNAHVAVARYQGLEGVAAVYKASAKMPRSASETAVVGLVLDNTDQPMEGVTAKLLNTGGLQALTDVQGRFRIAGAPVGSVRLRIEGATTTRPGTWPALEFVMTTIAGQDNDTGGPIRLPPVNSDNSFLVGGNEAVVVTMRDVPGMTLTVYPHSAIFPNGDTVGRLSLSQVKLDKVPMPPPNGSIFMPPAWTAQPPGVFFDPPAKITIPNDGLPPGRIIDIFQFDHDLEFFTNVGTGTVTADGLLIVSDPGFGITKTGWGGCGQPPPPATCAGGCDDGNDCTDDKCVNGSCQHTPKADGGACDDKDSCTKGEKCGGGTCGKGDPVYNLSGSDADKKTFMDMMKRCQGIKAIENICKDGGINGITINAGRNQGQTLIDAFDTNDVDLDDLEAVDAKRCAWASDSCENIAHFMQERLQRGDGFGVAHAAGMAAESDYRKDKGLSGSLVDIYNCTGGICMDYDDDGDGTADRTEKWLTTDNQITKIECTP